jgi:hypothetical protein
MRRSASFLTAMIVGSTAARAYVPETTSAGTRVSWRDNCPQFTLDATENPDVPHDRLRAVLHDAAAAWSAASAACNNPYIAVTSSTSLGRGIAFDDVNLVIWRLPGFCDDATNPDAEICLTPSLTALTTLFYYDNPGDPRDGEIVQADIEVNATVRHYSVTGELGSMDIQEIMTHEFGHVLGLDHTCTTADTSSAVDSHDQPVPPCSPQTSLTAEVLSATMYPYQYEGETAKRVPQPDEMGGICAIYAGHADPCSAPGGSGCQVTPRSLALPIGLVILVAVSLLVLLVYLLVRSCTGA